MILSRQLKLLFILLSTLGIAAWSTFTRAEPASAQDCRVSQPDRVVSKKHLPFSDAVLWKVTKANGAPSYIFGTIHVSDPEINNLPEPVKQALTNAQEFVMEAVPEPEQMMQFSQMMFFQNEDTLNNYLDKDLFDRTVKILGKYNMPLQAVTQMKPWAAFLVMNYPADQGVALDLQLLQIASERGEKIQGLESMTEQANVFAGMDMNEQVQLLIDTVCNYDDVVAEFDSMKTMYKQRDLQGLYYNAISSFPDEKLYNDLMDRILTKRNKNMAQRAVPFLDSGNSFIAIGAMHLPGEQGVLSLLQQDGYTLQAVY